MNLIQTIRMGILAFAAACALGACTQPANGPYGTRGAPPDSREAQSTTTTPDANARGDTRPAPGTLMPQGAAGGESADGPSTGANDVQGARPLPGTPPLMQY
ncbi:MULTISPECIES: hypothetical protein [unclassified Burkholderia]|uniref:hypothetical protein n=1 Tax=unclassified Burkholderia TaxID=2613784 RepID=UPI00141ED924|nr:MULTISPECIES: hypothetical protein [unclassified Burkholderia]NIE57035.1 hypothetical protein [Burkholderia sp. Ap-955]NIF13791.1 hypothetical protein [Burkholderia sp. Ax-1735]NIG06784.1 hypothetical protein [Burkholderia sp. Tr-849]